MNHMNITQYKSKQHLKIISVTKIKDKKGNVMVKYVHLNVVLGSKFKLFFTTT